MQARRRQGTPIGTLMHDYRISKATVYRYLSEADPAHSRPADAAPSADVTTTAGDRGTSPPSLSPAGKGLPVSKHDGQGSVGW